MRVTGGIFKGRILKSAPGLTVRPTTDKIRQAIFNILMHDIEDKDVLDIFAGSGALGIEAISRGARSALFIEKGCLQSAAIKKNLESLGLDLGVRQADYKSACLRLKDQGRQFDIIFADPPYEKITPTEVADMVVQYNLLRPEGFLIIECKSGGEMRNELFIPLKERKFGQTEITFYTFRGISGKENSDISGNL